MRRVTMGQSQTVTGELIQIWCFQFIIAKTMQIAITEIITQHDQKIRPLTRPRLICSKQHHDGTSDNSETTPTPQLPTVFRNQWSTPYMIKIAVFRHESDKTTTQLSVKIAKVCSSSKLKPLRPIGNGCRGRLETSPRVPDGHNKFS